jgi:putative CocE/NonD family hydrolase
MQTGETRDGVTVIENLFIPLSDGTRLAARLWLPVDAEQKPVPAVLEFIPYRKTDGTRGRDEPMHGWFARHGTAAIRVDQRGSGESDGFLDDEYIKQEQDDAIEVIEWLAAQPWCSGSVGMMGKSWGGFNCLQVAARRPPALKAVLSVCSTDDRYTDDIHYMGGCLLNDNFWWGAIMLAYQARPLDPAIVGETWRDSWLARLRHMPFWPALWLNHQRRDAYWQHGSICEDWDAINIPVMITGGWADAYTNTLPRLLAGLKVPRLGIIGPWAHIYPQDGIPGPAIGFLQEAQRWWDHWLKGEDNGIMKEPMLRAYIEDETGAGHWSDHRQGYWAAESEWPSKRIVPQNFHLNDGALSLTRGTESEIAFRSPHYTGMAVGEWMGTGVAGEQPADQRVDDGMSLVFDTEPLTEDITLLGAPEIIVEIASDKPIAQLCARLCNVRTDGASHRVSYGVLNLTHRESHANPTPLVPGAFYKVGLTLNACGHVFRKGTRIRLALSTAYWPLIWPSPEAATLTIKTGSSILKLPVRQASDADAAVRFEPPMSAPHAPTTLLREGHAERTVSLDLLNNSSTYRTIGEGGVFGEGVLRFDENGISLQHDLNRELTISGDDPLCARYVITQAYEMGREGWMTRSETTMEMTATATHFQMKCRLEAFENGLSRLVREWDETIARDLI